MHKKLTISIDENVYERLIHKVGRGKISQFLENLARENLAQDTLADGYKAMAADKQRETEANEWCEGVRWSG